MKERRQVFIIGVDHRIQYLNASCGPEWTRDVRRFQQYLAEQVRERRADLVAEEFSQALVHTNKAEASTVQEVAARSSIDHLFCDPDAPERETRGIATSAQREAQWLERLRGSAHRCILFVCGDDHVISFQQLLSQNGFAAEALSQGWGQGWQLKN